MKFKAVFFDWDLTLVNSLKANKLSYKAVCKQAGTKEHKDEFRRFMGNSVTSNVNYFYKKYKGSKSKLRTALKDGFLKNLGTIRVYDKNITNELRKFGLKIAIITGNSEKVVKSVAKKHKMKLDMIVGDEHTKGRNKLWAIKYLLNKFRLKKKDVIYVGDHINDIKQAHRAGVKSMIVPSYVYRKNYLKKFHPEFICNNLKCVKKVVEK